MKPESLEIIRININQAKELSDLLLFSDKNYTQHFIPFQFDLDSVAAVLNKAINDLFFGIYVNHKIVGFYMLRGWDAGFEIPSYGVWISKDFSSRGLSKLTLNHAISVCKINSIKKIMLKVHPDNLIAKKIYENFGFIYQGIDEKIGHFVFTKEID